MKTALAITLINLISLSGFSQNFTNLRKLVNVHDSFDTEYLDQNGFTQDTTSEYEVWYNDSTNEQVDFYENSTVFSFDGGMWIDRVFGEVTYTGKVISKIRLRPWWFTGDVDFGEGEEIMADAVLIKGHWMALYFNPDIEKMCLVVYE